MIAWAWAAVAFAGVPKVPPAPPAPVEQACALDNLPDGRVRWSAAGIVEVLMADGYRLAEIDVGEPIGPRAKVTCEGKILTIFEQAADVTLSFNEIRLDLGETLATLARDPLDDAASRARAALRAGDPALAADAIRSFPASDARVAALWRDIGRAALAGARGGADGLARLQPALDALAAPGWSPQEVAAIRVAEAEALRAAGRDPIPSCEAALAADPRSTGARLVLADALWRAGDEKRAREEYATVAGQLPKGEWPAELPVRCKKCR